jgi:hypothetical protein
MMICHGWGMEYVAFATDREVGGHYVKLRCHMTVKQFTSNRCIIHIDFK